MRRRDFLGAVAGGAAASAFGLPATRSGCVDSAGIGPGLQPLGLQLYTLRSLLAEDVPGTLAAVADIGYREVELAGLHGRSPRDMRTLLDDAGLRAPSGHVSLGDVRRELDRLMEDAATLGQRHLVVPSVPGNERSREGWGRVADDLNRAGERARGSGFVLGYHNHDFEFEPLGGSGGDTGYDLLLARTEPDLVKLQMDVYWTVHGGADPLAYLRSHAGRFVSIHAKDRTAQGRMAAVGDGVIDFAEILREARGQGLEHVFVEHDDPADPLESVGRSYRSLAALDA